METALAAFNALRCPPGGQKYLQVDLRYSRAGIILELPLEPDGTLAPWREHLRSLERVVNLMWPPDEQASISADELRARRYLDKVLADGARGRKLLSAMQEFQRRRQRGLAIAAVSMGMAAFLALHGSESAQEERAARKSRRHRRLLSGRL